MNSFSKAKVKCRIGSVEVKKWKWNAEEEEVLRWNKWATAASCCTSQKSLMRGKQKVWRECWWCWLVKSMKIIWTSTEFCELWYVMENPAAPTLLVTVRCQTLYLLEILAWLSISSDRLSKLVLSGAIIFTIFSCSSRYWISRAGLIVHFTGHTVIG